MKKTLLCLAVLVIVLVLPMSADEKDKAKKEVTVTGEIVDVKCYVTGMMGGMGEDHKQCAIDCIKGGLPAGIYDEKEKKVYTLVPAKGMKGASEDLAKHAAERMKVTGTIVKKDGAELFLYTKLEEVK